MTKIIKHFGSDRLAATMFLQYLVVVTLISKCSTVNLTAAPLRDDHRALLVALVDTSKIFEQILESLNEPLRQIINDTIEENVPKIVERKISKLKKRCCLKKLDTTERKLTSLPPGLFDSMSKLIELKLSNMEKQYEEKLDSMGKKITHLETELTGMKTNGELRCSYISYCTSKCACLILIY